MFPTVFEGNIKKLMTVIDVVTTFTVKFKKSWTGRMFLIFHCDILNDTS